MKNSPEVTTAGIASVLSISPIEEDHFVLQDILNLLDGSLDLHRTFFTEVLLQAFKRAFHLAGLSIRGGRL